LLHDVITPKTHSMQAAHQKRKVFFISLVKIYLFSLIPLQR
jgi:hypothetical protein